MQSYAFSGLFEELFEFYRACYVSVSPSGNTHALENRANENILFLLLSLLPRSLV